jgi:FMN reductase
MALVVTVGGSPSATSKTLLLLALIRTRLEALGVETGAVSVRDLPAEDLLSARANVPAIQEAVQSVQRAQGVIVATPIYKAAYSGILKTFLDLLPPDTLAGKMVLPVATGGTLAHMLALDYALRPVLVALGAQHILSSVYLLDSQFVSQSGAPVELETATDEKLNTTLSQFAELLKQD